VASKWRARRIIKASLRRFVGLAHRRQAAHGHLARLLRLRPPWEAGNRKRISVTATVPTTKFQGCIDRAGKRKRISVSATVPTTKFHGGTLAQQPAQLEPQRAQLDHRLCVPDLRGKSQNGQLLSRGGCPNRWRWRLTETTATQ
jgi:hypothetical protein